MNELSGQCDLIHHLFIDHWPLAIILLINIQVIIIMDYLLNRYLFAYLPFELSEEWKKSITTAGMSTIKVADWLCKTQDIWNFYSNHASFLVVELLYPLLSLLTLYHAYRHSGRYVYTWLAITFYAFLAASLCYVHPIFDYQWHAQGILTFIGGRAPLSTLFGIYQFTFYVAYIFVQRMHLPAWAQGSATGVAALLLKLPYYIVGTKLLWWTYHANNPLIKDRIYGIPWAIMLFDVAAIDIIVVVLHSTRKLLLKDFYDWKKFGVEFTCAIIASLASFLFGIAQIFLLYSTTQYINVPVQLLIVVTLAAHVLNAYAADRHNPNPESKMGNPYWFDELSLAVSIHFIFLIFVISASTPGNIVSQGMHQPIGPCNATIRFEPFLGKSITYADYLCMEKIKDKNFDFKCIPGNVPPKFGEDIIEWYAICGTPSGKLYVEYIAVICSLCALASVILYQAAANSGKTPKIYSIVYRSATKKSN